MTQSPTSETWVIAAYMLPSKAQQNLHTKGSFAQRGAAQLHMSVDRFVQMSPALCAPGTSLHIVHNTNASDQRRGVEYHRFSDAAVAAESMPPMPVMDSRWVLISRLLQRDARWECAFVVDLTDVTLVAAPSCAALPRDRFYAASDGSSPKSARWLARRGELNEFNVSYPPAFRAFLDPMAYYRRCRANVSAPLLAGSGRQPCLYNAGIVGGRRPAFAAALAAVDARLCHSWAARKNRAMQIGSDMVAWNEAAVNASGRVLTGYPYGPLNLPMFGQMTHQDPTKAKEGAHCAGACRHRWLNASLGDYWFSHKAPKSWTLAAIPRACRPRGKHDARRGYAAPACVLPLCTRKAPHARTP